MLEDYNNRIDQGEVQDRLRNLQGETSTAFDPATVQYLGHDTWIVRLTMRLTEYMNTNGNLVKDVTVNYALRVVRYEGDAKANPWGLALDGFVATPQRVKTYV